MFGSLTSFDRMFDELLRLDRDSSALFSGSAGPASIRATGRGAFPPVNVGHTAETVEIYLFAPGIDPDKIDLTLQNQLLTLSGERQLSNEGDAQQGAKSNGYYLRERFSGRFRRAITLPEDVDPDRVEARYRDGMLHVIVHRRESSKPRQIQIQS